MPPFVSCQVSRLAGSGHSADPKKKFRRVGRWREKNMLEYVINLYTSKNQTNNLFAHFSSSILRCLLIYPPPSSPRPLIHQWFVNLLGRVSLLFIVQRYTIYCCRKLRSILVIVIDENKTSTLNENRLGGKWKFPQVRSFYSKDIHVFFNSTLCLLWIYPYERTCIDIYTMKFAFNWMKTQCWYIQIL